MRCISADNLILTIQSGVKVGQVLYSHSAVCELINAQPTVDVIDRKIVMHKIDKYCATQCSFAKYYFGRFNADDAMERLEKKCANCPLHEI